MKNTVVPGLADRQVKGLGATREGRVHDKRVWDEDGFRLPEGSEAYRDTGYQGAEMPGVIVYQPTKKPPQGELTEAEKESNRRISQVRVIVEHVIAGIKRCRIVSEVFRNTKDGYADRAMLIACGLHNFRSESRLHSY